MKTILYLPIDGYVISAKIKGFMPPFDYVITYNKFGIEVLKKAFEQISNVYDDSSINLRSIPHGIDNSVFYPLTEEKKKVAYKRFIGRTYDKINKSFIVLNANRPYFRKRMDITIAGFSIFSKNKPDNVLLYLHHSRTRIEERREILSLINDYKLSDRVILNEVNPEKDYMDDTELNELYNICAVGINSTMGEGWGMVSFEHAATGAAQIVPDHSACGELWRNYGLLLPADKPYDFDMCNSSMREVTPEDLAIALDKLYFNQKYREDLAAKGKKMVNHPDLQWNNIQNKWLVLFNEVLVSV